MFSSFRKEENSKFELPEQLKWFAQYSSSASHEPLFLTGEKYSEKIWKNGALSIQGIPVYESDSYVIAGEFWISNGQSLCEKYFIPYTDDLHLVAHLWEKEKEKTLNLLQGGFAFLLFEKNKKKLRVIRDAIGVRNIYIGTEGSRFTIAGRVKTVAQHVSKEIDELALRDYLCCSFVPGSQTMFKHIREVRPGEIITLPENKSFTYWSIQEDYVPLAEESLEWHARRLRATLEEVLQEYLPEGEDVGCYLSGGIDSSAIAALAKKLHNQDIQCYSIHFGNECPNELEYSGMLAKHCGMKQHVIEITSAEMWKLHREAISILDDPIGDPLTVPNLILAKKALPLTPIILNGEGGDPCFGGPKNQPMMLESLYRTAASARQELESAYLASFQKCKTDLPRLLNPSIYNSTKDARSVFAEDLLSKGHYVNKLLLINTKYKGADQILSKVNNITSAIGVEGRSPLFDKRIVDTSLRTPPQYKLKGSQEKAILKTALQDLVPEAIINRPKSGMMVPVQLWFRKYWQKDARKLLLSKNARIREFLNIQLVNDWLDYKDDMWGRYGVKLWLVCALELWLQENA